MRMSLLCLSEQAFIEPSPRGGRERMMQRRRPKGTQGRSTQNPLPLSLITNYYTS